MSHSKRCMLGCSKVRVHADECEYTAGTSTSTQITAWSHFPKENTKQNQWSAVSHHLAFSLSFKSCEWDTSGAQPELPTAAVSVCIMNWSCTIVEVESLPHFCQVHYSQKWLTNSIKFRLVAWSCSINKNLNTKVGLITIFLNKLFFWASSHEMCSWLMHKMHSQILSPPLFFDSLFSIFSPSLHYYLFLS